MTSNNSLVLLFILSFLVLAFGCFRTYDYQRGLSDGKSQCYPYAVPYSDSQGQGGN